MTEPTGRRRRANVAGGRTHRHEVWVSPEEEARLLLAASQQGAAGVTVPRLLVESALAVAAADGDLALETPTQRRARMVDLFELRRQLAIAALEVRRVGVNVNQLARKANAGDGAFPVTEAREYLLDEREFLRRSREIAEGIDVVIDQLRAEGVGT